MSELAKELEQAHREEFSARADLDGPRFGMELVVLLDELGLRTEQDPHNRRWMRSSHLRRPRPPPAGKRQLRPVAGDYAWLGCQHPAHVHWARWPKVTRWSLPGRWSRAAPARPLREQLRAAVERPILAPWRLHPREGGLIKAFPHTEHPFGLKILTADAGRPAELAPAPDDLAHAVTAALGRLGGTKAARSGGTHRPQPHQLTIDQAVLEHPDRLADVLSWAAGVVIAARGRNANNRIHNVLRHAHQNVHVMPAAPAVGAVADGLLPRPRLSGHWVADLLSWLREEQARWAGRAVADPEVFCIVQAWEAFVRLYRRRGKKATVDDRTVVGDRLVNNVGLAGSGSCWTRGRRAPTRGWVLIPTMC